MKTRILLAAVVLVMNMLEVKGQVEMAVVVPVQQTYISENTAQVFRSKLLGAMTANGVSSAEYTNVVVYPEVSFTREQMVEGGMRNIHVMEMQVNIICEHAVTGTVFHSTTITLNAEGVSKDKAIMNGISKLSNHDTRIEQFVAVARQKVETYYREHTQSLIARARNLATMQQYDEAIALLYAYPASVSGYDAVSKTITEIYSQYQREEQRRKREQEAAEARALAAQERAMKTAAEVEKQRIAAIRDVAVAYYKSRPKYYFIY